jgi:aminoglycoside phosphotransferase (APT) family kinase protein
MQGIDEPKVSAWLAEHIEGAEAPFDFTLIAGGRSNLTFRVVDSAGHAYVLRRPPLGHVLATAHDMGREHKIIAAVGTTDVPVPPALGLCTDDAVNGAPFYVMGYVPGVVLDSVERATALPEELRRPACEHLVDVLADLHAVDIDAVGLGDLAKRGGYIERQVKRWSTQWEGSKTRELPAIDEVARQLREHMPEQRGAVIAHGDYRFGNCLTDITQGRIAAVLDWELCTLGDTMADVGYIMNNWTEPDEQSPTGRGAVGAPTAAGGFPTRAEFLEKYSQLTGRDVSRVDYYRAFQYWRLAAIVEGVLNRYLKGVMGGEADTDAFRQQVDGLAESAQELLAQRS